MMKAMLVGSEIAESAKTEIVGDDRCFPPAAFCKEFFLGLTKKATITTNTHVRTQSEPVNAGLLRPSW